MFDCFVVLKILLVRWYKEVDIFVAHQTIVKGDTYISSCMGRLVEGIHFSYIEKLSKGAILVVKLEHRWGNKYQDAKKKRKG